MEMRETTLLNQDQCPHQMLDEVLSSAEDHDSYATSE